MPESFVRRNLSTILVAMVTAAVTGGGSAVAATVVDFARNADKVDNIHAGPATTASRANKLIATGEDGRLPVGIIPPANADKVDGLHAVTSGSTAKAGKLVATDGSGQFPTSVIPKDATPYSRYLLVRGDAGTAAQNAARLQAKVNSVTGSATNRYVVLVEPGAYDFGTGRLTMKPFVDVVGAGPGRTVLTGGGGATDDAATVRLAADSALRQVTVRARASSATAAAYVGGVTFAEHSGGGEVTDSEIDAGYAMPQSGAGKAYGVRHTGAYLTLRRVTIDVFNGGETNHGVYNRGFLTAEQTTAIANGGAPKNYGIETDGEASQYMTYSAVTLTDSAFSAHNGGVNWGLKSYNGYGRIVRTRLEGSIGLESHTADLVEETFEIDGGTLAGSASTIVLYPRNSARIWRGAQLDGGPVNNFGGATGTVTCNGVYSETRVFHASSCP